MVIVISTSSQNMHVFRDGVLWRSSPVSTGKRGKETPTGIFAILQKRRHHRSNLYSNAPMPFMQRLTWDGIAIHAGRLPGYPASHGCIRLPHDFASDLFRMTGFTSTAVIVVDEPLEDDTAALRIAKRTDAAIPIDPKLLEEKPMRVARPEHALHLLPPTLPVSAAPAPPAPSGPTMQLAAASSDAEAQAEWARLARQHKKLGPMAMTVVPATVDGVRYYRLQASAPDAHAVCSELKDAGTNCFIVN